MRGVMTSGQPDRARVGRRFACTGEEQAIARLGEKFRLELASRLARLPARAQHAFARSVAALEEGARRERRRHPATGRAVARIVLDEMPGIIGLNQLNMIIVNDLELRELVPRVRAVRVR